MIPSKSTALVEPRLPVIRASDVDSNWEDEDSGDNMGFGSDEEIEVLLRKTKFLRHSKSAHADLAPPPPAAKKKPHRLNGYGIQEEREETSSDSDEEFYVHQSLLPFRKSKSTNAGFAFANKKHDLKSIGTFKASEVLQVIEKQTKEMLRSQDTVATAFVSNQIDYWPPPDEPAQNKNDEKRESIARNRIKNKTDSFMGDVMNEGLPMLIPFGRTASVDSDGQISIKAWSAPSQIDGDSDAEVDDIELGEERIRSWSASDRVPLRQDEQQRFNQQKNISFSLEHFAIDESSDADEDGVNFACWKGHHSFDDVADAEKDELTSEYSYEHGDADDEVGISRIDEENEHEAANACLGSSPSLSTSSSASSEVVCGSNESLHTPRSQEATPSPIIAASRSDSHLVFYVADRPRTPLCGMQNPVNSSQQIYDPWHADVEDVPAAPIRSRSLHDTIESEERLVLHCQMCPSPDCQQLMEDRRERKSSVRVNVEAWNDDVIDRAVDSEFAQWKLQAAPAAAAKDDDDGVKAFEGQVTGNHTYLDDEEIPMADDLEVESSLTPFLARKTVMRRRSPPIASEDELSDVEMTDILSDDEEQVRTVHKYNLSGLVRKSASDYTCGSRGTDRMKVDESVGNLNYWLNEQGLDKRATVKRSSTTSAISRKDVSAPRPACNEPIYENLRQPCSTAKPLSMPGAMEPLPTFLTFHQQRGQQQQQLHGYSHHIQPRAMKKSATSTGFPNSRRRLLPLRPDFPPTPEESSEYANLPCSKSYHEHVGSFPSSSASKPPFDLACFFPTTSYNISKEMQHENFARIQMQMEAEQAAAERPAKLVIQREPSFTALTLADEIENEQNGMPPSTIDPKLAQRIRGGPVRLLEDLSPTSPNSMFPGSGKKTTRRTLPPLPIDAFSAMSQSPVYPAPIVPMQQARAPQNPKDDHQICFGIEASMIRSTSDVYGMDDSYYEDGINGNFNFPRKSNSLYNTQEDSSGVSSCCTGPDMAPTHRAQSSFIPRHDDEVLLEVGDAVHVERHCEDHWCFGTNLRTGQHGIFPSVHVCEIDFVEEITSGALSGSSIPARLPDTSERDVFYLKMLASIEVAHHKGNDVLVQSINKVCQMYQNKEEIIVPQTVLMEVSFRGIHIIDKRRKDFFKCPSFDFFYSLQNISFCGAHPKQLRYFGFITKHPLLPRFACHVFLSNESTQPIVESIGRAFKRSYDEYMAFAHKTDDCWLE